MFVRIPNRYLLQATAFVTLLLLAASYRGTLLFAAYGALALYLIMLNLRDLGELPLRERCAALFIAASMTALLPLAAVESVTALAHYFIGMISLGTALVLSRHPAQLLGATRVTLIAIQVLLLAYSLSVGVKERPLDLLLEPHSSSNGVTASLIIAQAAYSALRYVVQRRTSVLSSVTTLVICIIGLGRGSLVAAAMIVAVNLAFKFSWKRSWLAALVLIILTLAMSNVTDVVQLVVQNTKLRGGLEDAPRQEMIADYLGRMNGLTAVVGASYQGTSIQENYLGNPHNSYIRAHHLFGIFYLVSIAAFPFLLLRPRQSIAPQAFVTLMLLVMLLRAFTEPMLFPTPFDFYFFAVCLALGNCTVRESPKSIAGEKGAIGPIPARKREGSAEPGPA